MEPRLQWPEAFIALFHIFKQQRYTWLSCKAFISALENMRMREIVLDSTDTNDKVHNVA